MDISSIVTRNKSILVTEIDDEIGMLNIDKGNYYTVNPVGKRIWEVLENEILIKELINILLSEYDIDFNTCKLDTIELLDLMFEHGLIILKN